MKVFLLLFLFIKQEQSILFEFNIKIEFWLEFELFNIKSLLFGFIKLFDKFSFSVKNEKFEIIVLKSLVIKLWIKFLEKFFSFVIFEDKKILFNVFEPWKYLWIFFKYFSSVNLEFFRNKKSKMKFILISSWLQFNKE